MFVPESIGYQFKFLLLIDKFYIDFVSCKILLKDKVIISLNF